MVRAASATLDRMTLHPPIVVVITTVAVALGAAAPVGAQPWRGSVSTGSFTSFSGSGTVPVQGGGGATGTVRARYLLPRRWQHTSALNRRTLRLQTGNSCRHRVSFTPRLVLAARVPAAERAAALLPAGAAYVRAYGTRERAAFRVIRVKGSATVRGVIVQPLSQAANQGLPADRWLYAEISAVATADPRRECHAGGPRSVADAIADTFARSGSVGGFAHWR